MLYMGVLGCRLLICCIYK
uniref:Uncharacterized protein n=1 Tax=Anguilla anguilla TaxID=7936 RepID=A0A0E9U7B8_ANGAN